MVQELVKGELQWPIDKCESCGFDLREATPKANEKANDAAGRLTWNDFCPKCGHGYQVGERVIPQKTAEELAKLEAEKVVKKEEAQLEKIEDLDPEHQVSLGTAVVGKASGIPPDKRGKDLAKKIEASETGEVETGLDPEHQLESEDAGNLAGEHDLPEGQYWCTKCAKIHNKEKSKVGAKHLQYAE